MKTQNKQNLFAVLVIMAMTTMMALAISGCNGGGHGGGGYSGGGTYDPYKNLWYNVYGQQCGYGNPKPGCNFYSDGTKIIDLEDPYFGSSNTLYFDTWYYTDSFGYSRSYLGWGWLSNTGIIYTDLGSALNQDSEAGDRDLIASAAEEEMRNVESAGKEFSERYSLSEETGIRLAKTLNDWSNLAKSRSRTAEDIKEFSTRIYGVDFNKVTVALENAQHGDKALLRESLDEMSSSWGVTPETSKVILKDTYGDLLKDFDI